MWSRNSRQNICGDLGCDAQMRLPRWATIETRQKCCGWKGVEERDVMMSARASVAHMVSGASAAECGDELTRGLVRQDKLGCVGEGLT